MAVLLVVSVPVCSSSVFYRAVGARVQVARPVVKHLTGSSPSAWVGATTITLYLYTFV
jgi:hypothetical protein